MTALHRTMFISHRQIKSVSRAASLLSPTAVMFSAQSQRAVAIAYRDWLTERLPLAEPNIKISKVAHPRVRVIRLIRKDYVLLSSSCRFLFFCPLFLLLIPLDTCAVVDIGSCRYFPRRKCWFWWSRRVLSGLSRWRHLPFQFRTASNRPVQASHKEIGMLTSNLINLSILQTACFTSTSKPRLLTSLPATNCDDNHESNKQKLRLFSTYS